MLLLILAASTAPAEDELVAVDRRIQAAMVSNEAFVLRRYIADDFRFTHANGFVETKADVLRTAALKPQYYIRRRVVRAASEVYGRFGLVVGSLDVASGPTPEDPPSAQAVCYT